MCTPIIRICVYVAMYAPFSMSEIIIVKIRYLQLVYSFEKKSVMIFCCNREILSKNAHATYVCTFRTHGNALKRETKSRGSAARGGHGSRWWLVGSLQEREKQRKRE